MGALRMHASTEAGAEDDRHIWPQTTDSLGEPFSCHMRHGLVRDHEIKALRRGAEHGEGFGAAGARHHLIAETLQDGLPEAHQDLFIIDEKHALCTRRSGSRRLSLLWCGVMCPVSAQRQV